MNNRGDVELVVKTNSALALSSSAPPTAAADAITADPLSDASFPENGKLSKFLSGLSLILKAKIMLCDSEY